MPRDFKLPDLGEGLTEAEIVRVLVAEGDLVSEDQAVLLVETEKAQVELPSPFGGRVAKVHVRPGQRVKVGSVLLSFGDGGPTESPIVRAGGDRLASPPRTIGARGGGAASAAEPPVGGAG